MQLANAYGYRYAAPRMERVLEQIENGQVGYVTVMGMGGVFMALLFLILFITVLGKAYRFKKLRRRNPSPTAHNPAQPPVEQSPSGGEMAAALAVALALSGKSRRTGVSIKPGPAEEELSPWKTAGRLSMTRPFAQPKRD
jgi:sodium pump decarboxylase gamma subunit